MAKNLVLLDFASEMNRGDAAMQESILDIASQKFPQHNKIVIAVYGSNQKEFFSKHFDCSIAHGTRIIGGVRKTRNKLSYNINQNKAFNIYSILVGYIKLFVTYFFGPTTILGGSKQTVDTINQSDLVIWNGRNFRDRKGLGEVYDILAMLLNPLFAVVLGKKMIAVGISIWPLKSRISRVMLKYVLSKCLFVTSRESSTLNYAREILKLDNIVLRKDLSFYYIEKYLEKNKVILRRSESVALTLVDWKELGKAARKRYIQSLANLLVYLKRNQYLVEVIPQVYFEWESYKGLLEEIYEVSPELKGYVCEINKFLTPEALFAKYSETECLVATRMHSAIFGLMCGCKVMLIPYDVGAKWCILSDLGFNEKYSVEYGSSDENCLIETFINLKYDSNYFSTINTNVTALKKDAMAAITDFEVHANFL